jgi:hypothetical protein
LSTSKGEYKASSLPWGSTTSPKKTSIQEEKGHLATPEDGYRASSLPRGSKIFPTTTSVVEKKRGEEDSKGFVGEAPYPIAVYIDIGLY